MATTDLSAQCMSASMVEYSLCIVYPGRWLLGSSLLTVLHGISAPRTPAICATAGAATSSAAVTCRLVAAKVTTDNGSRAANKSRGKTHRGADLDGCSSTRGSTKHRVKGNNRILIRSDTTPHRSPGVLTLRLFAANLPAPWQTLEVAAPANSTCNYLKRDPVTCLVYTPASTPDLDSYLGLSPTALGAVATKPCLNYWLPLPTPLVII